MCRGNPSRCLEDVEISKLAGATNQISVVPELKAPVLREATSLNTSEDSSSEKFLPTVPWVGSDRYSTAGYLIGVLQHDAMVCKNNIFDRLFRIVPFTGTSQKRYTNLFQP